MLGNVISALAEKSSGKKGVFVPYRNSSLTRSVIRVRERESVKEWGSKRKQMKDTEKRTKEREGRKR